MAPRTRLDAKIWVSIQKNFPGPSPDPLSGLKVRESGFFRTFAHNIFRLLRRRCRLLMSCRYEPYASFAPTQTIFTQKRKMLWRIYGRVLRSQKRHFNGNVILSGHVTHRWKQFVDLVPESKRSRRCDQKWPSRRSPCFYFSPVPYYHWHIGLGLCIRSCIELDAHSTRTCRLAL